MAVDAAGMGVRRCTVKRIVVAGSTGGGGYLDQTAVIRRYRRMGGLPTRGMTGLAVAARGKVFAYRIALETSVGCAMAVGAVFSMRGGSGAGQCILMTACTVISTTCGYQ